MTTFAPAARHASAWAFCLVGSLRALLIEALMPAFSLKAAAKSGASNCTQRTDDLVSGNSTHTCTLAACFARAAVAPATVPTATARQAPTIRTVFLGSLHT